MGDWPFGEDNERSLCLALWLGSITFSILYVVSNYVPLWVRMVETCPVQPIRWLLCTESLGRREDAPSVVSRTLVKVQADESRLQTAMSAANAQHQHLLQSQTATHESTLQAMKAEHQAELGRVRASALQVVQTLRQTLELAQRRNKETSEELERVKEKASTRASHLGSVVETRIAGSPLTQIKRRPRLPPQLPQNRRKITTLPPPSPPTATPTPTTTIKKTSCNEAQRYVRKTTIPPPTPALLTTRKTSCNEAQKCIKKITTPTKQPAIRTGVGHIKDPHTSTKERSKSVYDTPPFTDFSRAQEQDCTAITTFSPSKLRSIIRIVDENASEEPTSGINAMDMGELCHRVKAIRFGIRKRVRFNIAADDEKIATTTPSMTEDAKIGAQEDTSSPTIVNPTPTILPNHEDLQPVACNDSMQGVLQNSIEPTSDSDSQQPMDGVLESAQFDADIPSTPAVPSPTIEQTNAFEEVPQLPIPTTPEADTSMTDDFNSPNIFDDYWNNNPDDLESGTVKTAMNTDSLNTNLEQAPQNEVMSDAFDFSFPTTSNPFTDNTATTIDTQPPSLDIDMENSFDNISSPFMRRHASPPSTIPPHPQQPLPPNPATFEIPGLDLLNKALKEEATADESTPENEEEENTIKHDEFSEQLTGEEEVVVDDEGFGEDIIRQDIYSERLTGEEEEIVDDGEGEGYGDDAVSDNDNRLVYSPVYSPSVDTSSDSGSGSGKVDDEGGDDDEDSGEQAQEEPEQNGEEDDDEEVVGEEKEELPRRRRLPMPSITYTPTPHTSTSPPASRVWKMLVPRLRRH